MFLFGYAAVEHLGGGERDWGRTITNPESAGNTEANHFPESHDDPASLGGSPPKGELSGFSEMIPKDLSLKFSVREVRTHHRAQQHHPHCQQLLRVNDPERPHSRFAC
ncbi:MAG: hypothetical protein J07HQX50_02116 [Haloquadratum sp. J07HQX50]|nr:MAG: hypothetical protein J07HQX50_02116 [Haloquadratum sp. J07HQX50]